MSRCLDLNRLQEEELTYRTILCAVALEENCDEDMLINLFKNEDQAPGRIKRLISMLVSERFLKWDPKNRRFTLTQKGDLVVGMIETDHCKV